MCWRATGPIFCPVPGVWLYGAPYLELALVPSSSVAAVATKSAGADRLPDVNVTCGGLSRDRGYGYRPLQTQT